MRVLIVEDDRDVAINISEYLEPRGIALDFAYNGQAALALLLDHALEHAFDVIVLDVGLPGVNGFTVAETLRQRQVNTPILFLTARDALEDKTTAFEIGADDYMVKPFALKELDLRVRALHRRATTTHARCLVFADLKYDLDTQLVVRNGRSVKLNRLQKSFLHLLMRDAPKLVTKQEIAHHLWRDDPPSLCTLRTLVFEVRSAIDIEDSPSLIHTEHGQGYALRLPNR